jgi:hypothetical protein
MQGGKDWIQQLARRYNETVPKLLRTEGTKTPEPKTGRCSTNISERSSRSC